MVHVLVHLRAGAKNPFKIDSWILAFRNLTSLEPTYHACGEKLLASCSSDTESCNQKTGCFLPNGSSTGCCLSNPDEGIRALCKCHSDCSYLLNWLDFAVDVSNGSSHDWKSHYFNSPTSTLGHNRKHHPHQGTSHAAFCEHQYQLVSRFASCWWGRIFG
jgi:hypothetical protein